MFRPTGRDRDSGRYNVRRYVGADCYRVLTLAYAAFFLSAHLAFIIAESFFFIAGLIGFRPEAFFWAGAAFFAPPLPFRLAHRCFIAALILARAAALM